MSVPVGSTTIDPDEYFTTDPGIPFHLLRRKKVTKPNNQGSSNQLALHGLDDMFNKFSDKNIKDGSQLSTFLPHLPGYIDAPGSNEDSLQGLIDKPPVGGRELVPLTEASLQGFRLMPGSVPDQFKFMNKPPEKKKKKHKHKHHDEPPQNGINVTESTREKKQKKRKKEDGSDKKKKEKKKKRKKDKKGDQDEPSAS
ncbi:mediator of RNA polymerase II transcription subunit 19-B-like [Hydractinia symbiolongicarpus]|uniref:mediator of RNA polymerase II transcription subunit 19-B-like n=1 Tax=Hydractinia symbiolongicarpus TaxID=13093 RepID=UPI00254CB2C3|nr:mediator of RNA polymerase II transcription subunit 19-B-like [Hydractinia symbiolongicarpus]